MSKKICFEAIPPDNAYTLKEILREKIHDFPEFKLYHIGGFGSGQVLTARLTSDDEAIVKRANALLDEMEKICVVKVVSSRL